MFAESCFTAFQVTSNSLKSLLSLLAHENTDISISIINLLQELADPDVIEGNEAAFELVKAFETEGGYELLVDNLSRLDESSPEDASGVYNTLSILENCCEITVCVCARHGLLAFIKQQPDAADAITAKTSILKWLFQRLQREELDSNKLYASELLALLLQQSSEGGKQLREVIKVN